MHIDFEINTPVFVHSIYNPPTERSGCDINLNTINRRELILLKEQIEDKFKLPAKTTYNLKIPNPLTIGFNSGERSQITQQFKNLILALNLSLCRSSITDTNILYTTQEIKFKSRYGNSGNTIIISDDYYLGTRMSENINEVYVLEVFKKIQQLGRYDIEPRADILNLLKALSEYESGMREYSRLFIFKHLFNALEFAINFNTEYTGTSFDKQVESVIDISQATVTQWREFYNRVKHVDKSNKDNITYVEGKNKVHSMILSVRNIAKKAIMNLLNTI